MKRIELMLVLLGIILVFLPGCVEKPAGTPVPTAAPTTAETIVPTVTPTIFPPQPTPTFEPGLPTTYRVWVDSDYGFYRIRAIRGNYSLELPPDFNVLNFNITLGDTVRWINDDSYDFPLTIVSDQGLFTGRTGLMRWQGDRFEYTFNKTGTYTFSIEEYQDIEKEKITVNQQSLNN